MLDPQGSHHPKRYLSFRRGQQLILRHPQRGNAEEAWAIFVSSPMHIWDFHFKHSFVTHSIWVGVQLNIHNQNLFFFRKYKSTYVNILQARIFDCQYTPIYILPLLNEGMYKKEKKAKYVLKHFFLSFSLLPLIKGFTLNQIKLKKTLT